jgi:hypothetical protein
MSLENILTPAEIEQHRSGEDILENSDTFDKLYEFYVNNGEMPYGTAKARDGDPAQWLADQLDRDLR